MSTPILIRPAIESDVADIAGLLMALTRAEGNPRVVEAAGLRDGLFGAARQVPLEALVAVAEECIVGVVLYYPGYDILSGTDGYHLGDMVVAENQRRRGIGRRLIGALAARNLARGGKWVSLTVLSKNETARAFYRSLGMVQVPVDFMAMGDRALAALLA